MKPSKSGPIASLAVLFAGVTIVTTAIPAAAQYVVEPISKKLVLTASLRTRWEGWNWFEPSGTENNDYDFIGTLARAGVQWKDEPFDINFEIQNTALIDLPTTASAPAPQGVLGLGGLYYAHNRARNDASVFVKQGYVVLKKLGVPGLSVKGGRFDFTEGNEALTGDPTLDWLKNIRLSQRMIGSFVWSAVGRSFDGGVVSYANAPFQLTGMVSHPTQGGFDLAGNKMIDDVDLAYVSANLIKPSFLPNGAARVFYIYYGDRRDQTKTDNRPLPVRNDPEERGANINMHTGGLDFIHVIPTAGGPIDTLAWGVVQSGDWGELDHTAWAWNLEAGWQPSKLPWKPWFRLGYTRSSGDDDPTDDIHETFFQMLPTARLHSFSTFYNMQNNEDGFVSMLLRPMPGLVSRTDFHNIRVSEGDDLWYQGSGATLANESRAVGFGYSGRPAGGDRELMRVLETSLSYDWTKNINTNLYYGHVFGGTIVRNIFENDDADFGYLEVTLKL